MSAAVDYRSSEEVIFLLKEAMKNMENQIGSDADEDLTMDVESQVAIASDPTEESQAAIASLPTGESVGAGGDSSEQPQSQPQPPAKKFPPTDAEFVKKVVLIKGRAVNSFRKSLSFPTLKAKISTPLMRFCVFERKYNHAGRSDRGSQPGKHGRRQSGNVGCEFLHRGPGTGQHHL